MNYISDLYSTLSEKPQDTLIDVEELEDIISELVLVNSMVNIVNSLGYREFSEELVVVLKERVGRLL
ncbi:MAG: hypothetical protein RMH84_05455, partial [Sulfolobales archaeon]|nr:hypothetical protein [Sulfolobales archaeon]